MYKFYNYRQLNLNKKEVNISILVYYLVMLKFTWYIRCWLYKNIICVIEYYCNIVDDYVIIVIKKKSCIIIAKFE